MPKSNETKSLPKLKTIHGVEIRKMPCGKYFEALQTLKDLPEDFMKELMQDKKDFKLSEMMSLEGIAELVMRLLVILPDFTFKFISKLMEIDESKIRNELTPIELLEIVKEFWKINQLESFFDQMKPVIQKLAPIINLIGFNEQLPSALKSE